MYAMVDGHGKMKNYIIQSYFWGQDLIVSFKYFLKIPIFLIIEEKDFSSIIKKIGIQFLSSLLLN